MCESRSQDTGVGNRRGGAAAHVRRVRAGRRRAITRQFGGLGLGLAIAKAVVEMHGGTIRAASDGAGPRRDVHRRLHADRAADNGGHAATTRRPAGAGQRHAACSRMLLVEDHPDTARTLAAAARAVGYDVRTANSVGAALQLADAEPFDVIVSDIGLPDAHRLRADAADPRPLRPSRASP